MIKCKHTIGVIKIFMLCENTYERIGGGRWKGENPKREGVCVWQPLKKQGIEKEGKKAVSFWKNLFTHFQQRFLSRFVNLI